MLDLLIWTQEDRSLACAHLFQRFRQRAVNAPAEFARSFPTAEARQRYEEIWRVMIDEIVQELPQLRTEMLNFVSWMFC